MSIRKGKNHILRSGLFFLFSSSDNKVERLQVLRADSSLLTFGGGGQAKGGADCEQARGCSLGPRRVLSRSHAGCCPGENWPTQPLRPSDQLLEAQTLPETVYVNTAHQKAQPHPPCSDAKLCPHRLSRFWGDFLCAQDYSCLGSFAENQL